MIGQYQAIYACIYSQLISLVIDRSPVQTKLQLIFSMRKSSTQISFVYLNVLQGTLSGADLGFLTGGFQW